MFHGRVVYMQNLQPGTWMNLTPCRVRRRAGEGEGVGHRAGQRDKSIHCEVPYSELGMYSLLGSVGA